MQHDKQVEKDYEEEEENEEDEDEWDTLIEEEDSHFDVKALSVMLCKIAMFGCQRSIF